MKDKNMAFTGKISQELQTESDKLKAKYKNEIISEQDAIKIAKEYRQHKKYEFIYDQERRISTEHLKSENYEYPYEIDWEHPNIRLEQKALKKDGSLSSGFGEKILVWSVWFLPSEGIDSGKGILRISVDIDAKKGKVFTKYSLEKL